MRQVKGKALFPRVANWKAGIAASSAVQVAPSSSSSSASVEPLSYYTAELVSYARPNSVRSAKFSAVQEALLTLCMLPEEHPLYLDPKASSRASALLGVLSSNLNISPPKLFPQDGEAAVLTWDLGMIKRLLTVDADDTDLMDISRRTFMRCDHELPEDETQQLSALLTELGAQHSMLPGSLVDEDA
ncbi:hypothetical protein ACIQUB_06345 [Rhizobium sp. NPDC090275]|uniref:hypothetical protein n=1 Tax=Rhizobium sp. NPDC090275 TaxID=3364498 RepID=UPI00383BE41C